MVSIQSWGETEFLIGIGPSWSVFENANGSKAKYQGIEQGIGINLNLLGDKEFGVDLQFKWVSGKHVNTSTNETQTEEFSETNSLIGLNLYIGNFFTFYDLGQFSFKQSTSGSYSSSIDYRFIGSQLGIGYKLKFNSVSLCITLQTESFTIPKESSGLLRDIPYSSNSAVIFVAVPFR